MILNQRTPRRRRGAMLVLIVVMLVGFLVTVAFSVDIALMHLSRTELRTATDAASKAAAQELSQSLNRGSAIARGQQIAARNTVNNAPLLLDPGDFDFGRSDAQPNGRFQFNLGGLPNNTVRVRGRKTAGSRSGAIPLFFGNVLGVEFFEPENQASSTFIERDIILVVDRSGSMGGQKIRDLISAIDIFVDTLSDTPVQESVGLASYEARASEDVQLTTNLPSISSRLRSLPIGGFTSISRGMQAGQSIIRRGRSTEFVERTMIVMTDGRHNRGPEPRGVAAALTGDRVQIHTITFGSNADQARMREVAQIGGGRHFHALSGNELREIYREIALTLSTVISE